MDIKTFIKQFIQPILLELYRACRNSIYPRYIWEGMYPHFRDVPAIGPGFSSVNWINAAIAHTQKMIAVSNNYGSVPTEVVEEYVFLPMLAAIACRRNGGKLRILDFGGGVGISYVHLLSSLVECPVIDYHIVELEWACQAGSRLFKHDGRIHFHRSLPSDLTEVDILHMNSVLQYIEDYVGLLKTLCVYQARYFLIGDLTAGDFPTYASAQKNMPGTVIQHWFLNMNEVVEIMKQGGYSLICKGAITDVYNLDGLPEGYRLDGGRTCTLLFERSHS